jgi:hypothetical protein
MENKTNNIGLYLSNLSSMDKWKNDNINYDIIDEKIKELNIVSGITETVNIYNNVEFIGALDTSIQTIVINGQAIRNPFYNQDIKEIKICEDVTFNGLSNFHFGANKEITLNKKLSKLYSINNKLVDFDGFKVNVISNMCIRNLAFHNLNGILLTGSVVMMVNIDFVNLKGSIEGTYQNILGLESQDTDQVGGLKQVNNFTALSGQKNTTSLRNITITGFDNQFSLFKNIGNINNLVITLSLKEAFYENIVFECVHNVKKCNIKYNIDGASKSFNNLSLTGCSFFTMNEKYKGDLYYSISDNKGLYHSSSIKTTGAFIALTTTTDNIEGKFKNKSLQNTLMFLSNIELNLINTGGKFNYCNNVDIKTNVNDIEFNDCINVKVGDLN